MYEEVGKHLNEMIEVGAIHRSNSPWASVQSQIGLHQCCMCSNPPGAPWSRSHP